MFYIAIGAGPRPEAGVRKLPNSLQKRSLDRIVRSERDHAPGRFALHRTSGSCRHGDQFLTTVTTPAIDKPPQSLPQPGHDHTGPVSAIHQNGAGTLLLYSAKKSHAGKVRQVWGSIQDQPVVARFGDAQDLSGLLAAAESDMDIVNDRQSAQP
ncbi:MAG: hypothetical protein R3C97_06525 [Geminicoccaceae bacterium]